MRCSVDSGASSCFAGTLASRSMSSCCPGIARGYGIQARTVLPAGTASASTVSVWVTRTRCGSTLLRPLAKAALRTAAWCGCGLSSGPSPIGGSFGSRRARACALRRNRLEGERLKYSLRPSITWCSNRPASSQAANSASRRSGICLRTRVFDLCAVEREIEQDAAHAFALEGERLAFLGRQARLAQRLRDARFGRLEVTGVDQFDHLRIAAPRAGFRAPRREARQRQQQAGARGHEQPLRLQASVCRLVHAVAYPGPMVV